MVYDKNILTLLHLSLIKDVGPSVFFKILKKMVKPQSTFDEDLDCSDFIGRSCIVELDVFYRYSVSDFVINIGLSQRLAEQIVNGLSDKALLDEELSLIERNNVKFVTIFDDFYPAGLRHIHCPPIILYYFGDKIDVDLKALAIVGSRDADDYAQQAIETIVPTMVSNGWSIVSGGAIGADTMAHKTTLDAGGKTIAVLGSGLLCQYPESNKGLFEEVSQKGGTVVSPFNLRVTPDKGNFPARNRIISGLSRGCLVVQAAARSGALITANFAMEQGRSVFAIPGRVDDRLSVGCNSLLKQGAKLVCDAGDILEDFGEQLSRGMFKPALKIVEKQDSFLGVSKYDSILMRLSSICTIDELITGTGLDLIELQSLLFDLQIQGLVRQTFSGAWERCK